MNPEKELFDEWYKKRFGDIEAANPHHLVILSLIRDGMEHAWIAGRNTLKIQIKEHQEWISLRDYQFCKHVEKEEENEY